MAATNSMAAIITITNNHAPMKRKVKPIMFKAITNATIIRMDMSVMIMAVVNNVDSNCDPFIL